MTENFTLHNKRVYIAGHQGMVGSALMRRLTEYDCEILSVSRENLDLTRQTDVERWLVREKPDVVVLAAARVGGILANQTYPADFITDNLLIQSNVIGGAYMAGVQKLLFLGSSCIYPKEAQQPITEDALLSGKLEPTNEAYAIAKIAGLQMCRSYARQYGANFITAMPCNLYGKGDRYDKLGSHVVPALIMKMHDAVRSGASQVSVWGSGKPLREFLYVDDLADALVFLLENYNGLDPVNVGTGDEVSIHDLALMIADIAGYKGDIVFDTGKPDGTLRKCLDNSRIHGLGWTAQTSLEDGLLQAYQWYQQKYVSQQAA